VSYPPELTKGQISRDVDQLGFEQNTARMVGVGNDLRQRFSEQHQAIQQNIDAFIDATDAQATNMREAGISVDTALQKQMNADKNRVRVAYAKADNSPEAQNPVDFTNPVANVVDTPTTLLDYLNNQVEGATETIIPTARKLAVHHGLATVDSNGNLIPANPSLKQVSKFRSDINAKINNQSSPDIRQGAIIKSFVDEHIGPSEGALYKAARNERVRVGRRWEDRKIIRDLVENKSGTSDRKVALENIQKRIVHDSSPDDLRIARCALPTP
jgi:hypothetical protein